MESGEEVEITYKNESITWCRSAADSKNNFITDIKSVRRPSGDVTAKIKESV
jgi:hypothetical protein